tara:strand:- start:422 stop:1501 length:1080 start_codon:yes stop_codon:yes gene_type:complete
MKTNEKVLKAFDSVKDVGTERSITELGWLKIVSVTPPKIVVRLTLPDFAHSQRGRIASDIRESIKSLDDIEEVQIEIGNSPPSESPIGQAGHGGQPQGLNQIPNVKNVLAISSGKGGVGKSTVAVNLACALSQKGFKVGLLDADIYGPNTPYMLGVSEQTPEVSGSGAEQKIIPIETCGIGMVSMGLLIDQNQPVIWRGPMLNGIIRQFLYQASWEERDFLIVDLPPGTGDAQLSLAQAVPMAGVIIVTTPQNVSLQDSRRGLAMFKQMNIPILGVIENMTYFIPPDQPEKSYEIFGSGGGMQLAQENNVPLLAQIPIESDIYSGTGKDLPVVHTSRESITAKVFLGLAGTLCNSLSVN